MNVKNFMNSVLAKFYRLAQPLTICMYDLGKLFKSSVPQL